MDLSVVNLPMVVNLFVLLLIGMGPKIALVPFLEKTKSLDADMQREVGTRMVKTAVVTALILFATGAILMRLLHISSSGVSVAGGIVLLILALKMASGVDEAKEEGAASDSPIDHHQMAIYPLAIPYLLNPVGIAVLIIASSKVETIGAGAIVVALVVLVGAFDLLIFRNADKLSKRMSPTSLIVSEVVFGILLTALAVELMVNGLAGFGIIEATAHH